MIRDFAKKGIRRWNRIWKPADISDLPLYPYSRKMGWERGTPIDRIYIERFLKKHKNKICGTVVEIGENLYTNKFGSNVGRSTVFTADKNAAGEVIIGDLQSGAGVRKDFADCFILTQTLPFIYDIQASCKNIVRSLKSGGGMP